METDTRARVDASRRRRVARFGPFRLDLDRGDLSDGDSRVPLQPKATRVLVELVRARGALVSHEELVRAVWGDVRSDVSSSLHNAVGRIREALGDEASRPGYVETVHRRGYRFVHPVEIESDDDDREPFDSSGPKVESGAVRRGRRVARRIAGAVVGIVTLLGSGLLLGHGTGTASRVPRAAATDLADSVLQGRYLVLHGSLPEVRQGRSILREAVAGEESLSALAWGGLAAAEIRLWNLDAAARAADRALELDLACHDALRVLGELDMYVHRRWERAERRLLRSLAMAPEAAATHVSYATLLSMLGRRQEAVQEARRARSLAPLSPVTNAELGLVLLVSRRYEEAAEQARHTLELDPDHGPAHELLHLTMYAAGDGAGARESLLALLDRDGIARADMKPATRSTDVLRRGYAALLSAMEGSAAEADPHHHLRKALLHMLLDDSGRAWQSLLEAEARNEPLLPLVVHFPHFAPLRQHPGFRSLVERLGLSSPAD